MEEDYRFQTKGPAANLSPPAPFGWVAGNGYLFQPEFEGDLGERVASMNRPEFTEGGGGTSQGL